MKNLAKALVLFVLLVELAAACSVRGPHKEGWSPGKPKKDHMEK